MKKMLATVVIGLVLACVIAAFHGADFTSAIVVGLFYTVPILFGLILPPWGPVVTAFTVLLTMVIAGPYVPSDQQDSVIASWAWLWVWLTIGVAIIALWTWIEQKRKARRGQ